MDNLVSPEGLVPRPRPGGGTVNSLTGPVMAAKVVPTVFPLPSIDQVVRDLQCCTLQDHEEGYCRALADCHLRDREYLYMGGQPEPLPIIIEDSDSEENTLEEALYEHFYA